MPIIKDLHKRSITKSITFRILVIIADFIVIFAITRSYNIAVGVLIATNVVSATLYYIHERVWNNIQWGRKTIQ